jgi:hypothetical protein
MVQVDLEWSRRIETERDLVEPRGAAHPSPVAIDYDSISGS